MIQREMAFSIIAIKVLSDNSDNIRKVLKDNEWYLLNQSYKVNKNGNGLEKNDKYPLYNDFFAKNISISAIVGKNGSGKTSVIDFILRIINNLTERLLQPNKGIERNGAEDFYCINNLNAELYFELNLKLCCLKIQPHPYTIQIDFSDGFKQYGKNLDINAENNQIGEQQLTWQDVRTILQSFFYTLVVNYSLHAYNKRDYSGECGKRGTYWVNSLFHKNDGYLAPLIITPYRGEEKGSKHCILDIDKEFNLANSRISALLLQHKFEQEQAEKNGKEKLQDFIDDYKLNWIVFHYDKNYVNSKYIFEPKDKKRHKNKNEYSVNLEKSDSIFFSYIDAYKDVYKLPKLNTSNDLMINAYKYLVYKTNMISNTYPSYNDFYEIRNIPDFDKTCDNDTKQKIKDLINKIKTDNSHITIKIKQTLHFIDQITTSNKDYTKDFEDKDYPINNFQNPKLSSLDNVMATFPPPFFVYKIYFTKKSTNEFIEFGKMSSGERQFLYTMGTVLYHIKNLMSVPNDNGRVKYKNFNIILDEIELCFHPEYQRGFVNRLIGYLTRLKMNETYNINVIIATHSPFILSDIPNCNIMYLKEGKQKLDDMSETFGANIHDILHHSFFLEKGFIGDFAQKKIREIIEAIKDKKINGNNYRKYTKTIDLIGEPLIKRKLLMMIEDVYDNQLEIIQDRKNLLQQEIDILEKKEKELKKEKK
jgi:hypothetical protein